MAKPKDPPKPNSGRVRISCDDPDFDLLGWLGPDSPKYTGGFGGWTVTPRPRQVGMVTYDGVEPIELQFQLLWDGILRADRRRRPYEHPSSIEPAIRDLLAVVRGDKESDPGIVKVEGIPSLPRVSREEHLARISEKLVSGKSTQAIRLIVLLSINTANGLTSVSSTMTWFVAPTKS
jgi:hypothetical protein